MEFVTAFHPISRTTTGNPQSLSWNLRPSMARTRTAVLGLLVLSTLCLGTLPAMISAYNNGEATYYGPYYTRKHAHMPLCSCLIDRFAPENCHKVCKFFSFCSHAYDEDDQTPEQFLNPAGDFAASACYGYNTRSFPFGTLIAAASSSLFRGGAGCGITYAVTCTGAPSSDGEFYPCSDNPTVAVTVVDFCPDCAEPGLALSQEAFSRIANPADADQIFIDFFPDDNF